MNQNPEQLARDRIDDKLTACGWIIQDKRSFNLAAGICVAIREYQTNAGPADYILFVNRRPVGLIEAKGEEEGVRLTAVKEQSTKYASARLKYFNNDLLLSVYEGTAEVPLSVNPEQQQSVQEIESRLSVCDKNGRNNDEQRKTDRGVRAKYFEKSIRRKTKLNI